ncbi:MAG: DUF669 domain-containing protein [Planctomycetota bacterium]
MANLNNFNANQIEPTSNLEAIPAGKYLAVITESELKPTKSGSGSYLQLTFQVLEGEYKGRFLWSRLNLQNANPTAVKIAQAELSAICRAVGVLTPGDSVELHNLPLVINVKCRKREDSGDVTNEIRGFSKREIAVENPIQGSSPTTPPWRR